MLPFLLLLCQITLAAILLFAATGKALRADQFLAALRLSHVPSALITPIGILAPLLEACLAIGLLVSTPASLPPTMAATLGLLGAFTAWMSFVSIRGLHLSCGCFGTGNAEVGPRTIGRNALLMALSLGGLLLALHARSPLPPPSLWLGITVLSCGLCLALAQSFHYGQPGLILSWRALALAQERQRAEQNADT